MASLYRGASPFGAALLRASEGAVRAALHDHPEWQLDDRHSTARSIAKRVAGMVGAHWLRLSDLRAKARGAVRAAQVVTNLSADGASRVCDAPASDEALTYFDRRADGDALRYIPVRAARLRRVRVRCMEDVHRKCIGLLLADVRRAVKERGADPAVAAVRERALKDAAKRLRRMIDGEALPPLDEWVP